MDIHVIAPLATPAERAAVDALLGPPTSGWAGGGRDSTTDGHSAHGGHAARADAISCCRRSTPSRTGSAGSASRPSGYICRRLTVPPAEAYGVATFYALLATRERRADRGPRLRRHRLPAGRRRGDLRRPGASARPGRRAGRRRHDDLAAQPLPRPVRAGARGPVHDRRRSPAAGRGRADRRRRDQRPAQRGSRRTSDRRWIEPRGGPAPKPVGRGAPGGRPGLGPPGRRPGAAPAGPRRRRRSDLARRLPGGGGYAALARAIELGPEARHRRGDRLEAGRPGRRGVPDRPQVGRGGPPRRGASPTTSCATPTSPSRARSRTAS